MMCAALQPCFFYVFGLATLMLKCEADSGLIRWSDAHYGRSSIKALMRNLNANMPQAVILNGFEIEIPDSLAVSLILALDSGEGRVAPTGGVHCFSDIKWK